MRLCGWAPRGRTPDATSLLITLEVFRMQLSMCGRIRREKPFGSPLAAIVTRSNDRVTCLVTKKRVTTKPWLQPAVRHDIFTLRHLYPVRALGLVEASGIEPLTYGLQSRRSPS